MNFKVLNEDIYFSSEFTKLNEIREEFLEEAFNSVLIFAEKFNEKFSSVDQLLKDGESFGYDYLNKYINRAVEIINEFGVKEINNDIFFKDYYLNKYCTWEATLKEISNEINKVTVDTDEKVNANTDNISFVKLNINSELIKKPFSLKEKSIILNNDVLEKNLSLDIINKLIDSMVENIFNINFALIDVLKANNIDKVAKYSNIEEINESNKLIAELLKNQIAQDRESETIKRIITLNPYNENMYKALLYKYGDEENQFEELGEFLGYNNIHEYKHKLLDEYYRNLNTENYKEVCEAKEKLIIFANKLNIKEYSEYIDELNNMIKEDDTLVNSIETKEIDKADKTEKMATVEIGQDKPKKRSSNKSNKGLIILATILGSVVVIYLITTLYFSKHFFFRTSINGVNVSAKSDKTVQNLMASEASGYELTIKERNDVTEKINGADISLKYDFSSGINELLDNQNAFLWIAAMFKDNEYTIIDGISYDEVALKQMVGNLEALNENNIKEPVNAYINYTDSGYELVKEDIGNRIKYDEFYESILSHIQNINKTLDLDEEECYENPKYTTETQAVIDAKKLVDKYVATKITYNIGDNQEVIDSGIINTWINIDEDFNVIVNEEAIRQYVIGLGSTYDYLGNYRDFTRWSGEAIKISTTPGIYYIARDTTISEIVEAITSGKEVVKDISMTTPSATDDYVINTFVEVNLTNQTVVYYKNGELITQGNVVTGNVSAGNGTPSGVYRLDWKAKDFVLRGDGYASPVSFWMPFNGGIGLHDASWRSTFGGSIYQTNGSHGCVNMPYSVAEAIYNNIEDSTTIICRY